MSTRLRWPFLVAALLAAAALLLTYVWPANRADATAADDLPTAAQARPAEQLAASLPDVPGAVRDRFDTACGVPTPYCVTSTSLSARQLVTAIEQLLAARGAKRDNRTSCDDGTKEHFYALGDCAAKLRIARVNVLVTADGVRDFNGMRRPARAYVVVAAQFATPASKPLGSWASLRVFAPGWGTPACIATSPGGGCSHYQGLLTVRSPLARAIPVVQARLAGWGLAVTTSHCAMAAEHPGCIFAAMKFRGLGGRDPVYIDVVIATRSTPELTVVGVNVAS